ncbi:MAG: MFS transporter [Chloroflexi bacterium]|nr:MFS transporter [Chloroflexota bacterium]
MLEEKPSSPINEYQTGGWKAHWILIICTLLYAVNYMDRTVLTVVMQPMKMDLGLSDSDVGLAVTIFTLSIALFSIPILYIVDRWSRKKMLFLMAVAWSIFTYLTGLAKNFIGVLLPRMFVGVGEAGFSGGGTAMITAAYPKKKHGLMLGIFNTGITIGSALGMIIGGIVSVQLGWRFAFFIFAIPGLILGISALFLKDYKTVENTGSRSGLASLFQSIAALLKIPTLRWFFLGYGLLLLMSQAQMYWTVPLVMREFNIKEDSAGLVLSIGIPLAVIGALLGGWFSDFWHKKNRKGRMLLPAWTALLSAVFLAIAILVFHLNWQVAGAFATAYGFIYYVGMPALGAVSQEVIPPAHKGLSWGMTIFSMYMFGGAWSPWAVGGISDALGGGAGGLAWALLASCIGGIGAAFCFFMGSRTYVADADKVKDAVLVAEK